MARTRTLSAQTRRRFLELTGLSGLSLAGVHLLGCGDDGSAGTGGGSAASTTSGAGGGGGAGGSGSGDCSKGWWGCGNYAPVAESEATDLPVEGTLPPELDGLYLRNGPNPLSGSSEHWFLGDGMVHGVRLQGGKALWYRARYVQTEVLNGGSGGPPTLTEHQANTSVVHHAGRLLCLDEVGLPYELRSSDLTTIGPYDFAGALKTAMTAHPKIDPLTGELLFFGYHLFEPKVTLHRADAMGLLTKSEEILLPKSVMMHDFQLTATRVVFMDLPILFDFELALSGEGFPFRWDPTNGARLGVLPRDGTNADVVWTEIDPCFVFHTWNAFDDPADPAKVVLDAIRYPDMWAMGASDFSQAGAPVRFSIPTTAGGSVGMDVIEERAVEFPRIDPRKQGLPHRYGYGLLVEPDGGQGVVAAQTLAKYDFVSGTTVDIYMPDGLRIDEPTFVPASPDAGEDEGWLFVYGYDAATDKSELVILDASTNQVLARVKLPVRVPHGFHGTWVPGG